MDEWFQRGDPGQVSGARRAAPIVASCRAKTKLSWRAKFPSITSTALQTAPTTATSLTCNTAFFAASDSPVS